MASNADTSPDLDPVPPEEARRGRPRLAWLAALIVLAVVVLFGLRVVSGWPGWLPTIGNPFAEESTDRSQPVVLKSIQDLSRFTAASGNFEVVIDVENNRRFVPDFLINERTLFVAAGTVDAYVEFGGLAEGALVVDEANNTVEVALPAPELAPPNLDLDRSYVFAEERGVVNRLGELFGGDPDRQRQVFQLAEQRVAEAAASSGLLERAEENTGKMLEGMLGSLGYEKVTVTFGSP